MNRELERKFGGRCVVCKKPITSAAIIGIGRCCLKKDFGCPSHEMGELVVKKRWIGVKNCNQCSKEDYLPFVYGREKNINQIVWFS